MPRSAMILAPVMLREAAESRNTVASAISSGSISRCPGICDFQ